MDRRQFLAGGSGATVATIATWLPLTEVVLAEEAPSGVVTWSGNDWCWFDYAANRITWIWRDEWESVEEAYS